MIDLSVGSDAVFRQGSLSPFLVLPLSDYIYKTVCWEAVDLMYLGYKALGIMLEAMIYTVTSSPFQIYVTILQIASLSSP